MNKNEQLLNNYNSLNLKKLPAVLARKKYEFHLLERTDAVLMYTQVDPNTKKAHSYEVFKNRIAVTREINGNSPVFDFSEIYPLDEEFGKRAWSYPSYELAKTKYDSLA
jgi:hypothetical protein